jgi:glycosyltransferase involved in cell wall biosynthesis
MIGVAGNRSYEFARRLVSMGHEVHMVTSFNSAKENAWDWFETKEAGIHVHWLPVPYSNKMKFKSRIQAFVRFAIGASVRAGATLTIAIPGLFASWKNKKPFVFEVRDLWPEGAIQLGVLTSPTGKYLARFLERLTYSRACGIVALSPGMRDGIIEAGASPHKIAVIPNAADLDLFHPEIDGSEVRFEYNLTDRFSLAYFGTMGLANGLGFVLDAASELKRRGEHKIVFILHGDGMERSMLESKAQQLGLDNVIFSNPIADKQRVAQLAAAVDVCMTIYKNVPVLRTCSPNKMFDALAAGKPILTNMPGWLGDIAEQFETGVLVKPDDPIDFADKVLWMRNNPEELIKFGLNARRIAEEQFARDKLTQQFESVLSQAVAANRRPVIQVASSRGHHE